MIAKDKINNKKIQLLRKIIKTKIGMNFSNGFVNLMKQLTKFDGEDRCTPQEALSLEYVKSLKVKSNIITFDDILATNQDIINHDAEEALSESNTYLDKLLNSLAIMYQTGERLYALDEGSSTSLGGASSRGLIGGGSKMLRYNIDSEQINELSIELGCSKQLLFNGLKHVITNN